MKQVSVRELRQHASEWLRRVQSGETFEVTDRGRPVALLVPLPPGGELERLIASRRVRPPTKDGKAWPVPLAAKPGVPPPSEILEQLRADER